MKSIGFWSTAWATMFGFLALLWAIGTPAHSQTADSLPICSKSADVEKLPGSVNEALTAGGMMGADVFLLYTNKVTHKFTIIIRRTDGVSCVVVIGDGFALADPAHLNKPTL